jgi:hypothetical protein
MGEKTNHGVGGAVRVSSTEASTEGCNRFLLQFYYSHGSVNTDEKDEIHVCGGDDLR